jgi:hypothetical protein
MVVLPLASETVITDGDNPADVPKNPSRAGANSPDDIPCKYINGNTSTTLGDVRHHGGTIEDLNCIRPPLTGSTRRSFTRGASISIAPAAVLISLGSARPLRTARRRIHTDLVSERLDIRRSLSPKRRQHPTGSSTTIIQHRQRQRAGRLISDTFTIGVLLGVPALAVFHRSRKVRRPRAGRRSTGSGHTSRRHGSDGKHLSARPPATVREWAIWRAVTMLSESALPNLVRAPFVTFFLTTSLALLVITPVDTTAGRAWLLSQLAFSTVWKRPGFRFPARRSEQVKGPSDGGESEGKGVSPTTT